MKEENDLKSYLNETRSFKASVEFKKDALISSEDEYTRMWDLAKDNPKQFWGDQANELLDWHTPWNEVLTDDIPYTKWFSGAKINASYNCLDRHLTTWRKNKAAIIWEGESGESKTLTYQNLHREVSIFANVLKSMGVNKGDVVTIYLPMVPELAISVLACARIGALHSVIFAGFSSEAIANRNNDAKAKLVITADGGIRRSKIIPLKDNVDEALEKSTTVEKVIVLKRAENKVTLKKGRDYWWHNLAANVDSYCEATPVDSEHPLFLLYTSGSTGQPKGILHTTAGYLLGATLSSKYVFDLKDNDTFWCTADVGWITGHSYIIYGPLSNGATTLMYEGSPDTPDWGRFWNIVEKYKVNILYTAPTAIRALMGAGDEWAKKYNLDSLRLLGTVGEPINPKAWLWYHEVIGNKKCPIVDTWWQTETGSIMLTPLPGVTDTVPGSATKPFFGVVPKILNESGAEVKKGEGGYLVLEQPWPSMLRTIFNDNKRYEDQYWSKFPGKYFTGDAARCDEHGNYWIMGRVDDVINVSGHRLSTMEIESALVSHSCVTEAAVIGVEHDIKGEAIHCFVTLTKGSDQTKDLGDELKNHIVKQIGTLARPEVIRFSSTLPKTRSGKIMRRLLKDIAVNKAPKQDMSTLENISAVEDMLNN